MLTDQEIRFAEEYVKTGCKSSKTAALKAGYAEATARYACQWLNPKSPKKKYKGELVEYIEKLRKPRAKETIATAEQIMEFFTAILTGEETEHILDREGNIIDAPVSAKDRMKAAELLGKCHGMFTEHLRVDANVTDSRSELGELLSRRGGPVES